MMNPDPGPSASSVAVDPAAAAEPTLADVAHDPAVAELGKHRGFGRKLAFSLVLAVLAYGGLLFYGDAGAIAASVMTLSPVLGALALLLATGNFVLRFFRWHYYLLRLGLAVPWGESFLVFLAGFSMTVTPGKLGELIKSALLKERRGIAVATTAPIVLAERLTDVLGLLALMAIGAMGLSYGILPAAIGGGLVIAILVVASFRPAAQLSLRILGRIPFIGRVAPALDRAYESLRILIGPRPILWASLLSIGSWGLQCGSLYVLTSGFGGSTLTVKDSLFAYSAPLLAGTLALLPGGLGLTEASMAGALEQMGSLDAASAATVTILVRVVTFWWAIAVGVCALFTLRARRTSSTARHLVS